MLVVFTVNCTISVSVSCLIKCDGGIHVTYLMGSTHAILSAYGVYACEGDSDMLHKVDYLQ